MLVVIAFADCHDRILPIRPQLEPDVFLTFLSGARFSQRDEQVSQRLSRSRLVKQSGAVDYCQDS